MPASPENETMTIRLLPTLLTIEEVADQLQVTPRTIERWIVSREIPPPIRIGRRVRRWKVDELQEWIDGGCPALQTR
jgi:excisionase family DNA binding protein